MRAIKVLGLCAAVILPSVGTALAAEMIGGPLTPPVNGSLVCTVLNTGDQPLAQVTLEAFNSVGTSVGAIGFGQIPPLGIAEFTIPGFLNPRSCIISAPTAKSKMRGTVGVVDPDGVLHAVVEAR